MTTKQYERLESRLKRQRFKRLTWRVYIGFCIVTLLIAILMGLYVNSII